MTGMSLSVTVMRTLFCAVALALAAALLVVTRAYADTETCVSGGEYDRTTQGESVFDIARRFDVYGTFIGDTDNRFRRGYKTCWAPGERQVVVVFSYDDGLSVGWFVRDV